MDDGHGRFFSSCPGFESQPAHHDWRSFLVPYMRISRSMPAFWRHHTLLTARLTATAVVGGGAHGLGGRGGGRSGIEGRLRVRADRPRTWVPMTDPSSQS